MLSRDNILDSVTAIFYKNRGNPVLELPMICEIVGIVSNLGCKIEK